MGRGWGGLGPPIVLTGTFNLVSGHALRAALWLIVFISVWYSLIPRRPRSFEESEARGRELMITAIRELGTVLGSIKNGEKVKAGVEISDEEDWTPCVNSSFGKHKADSDILLWNILLSFVLFLYLNSRLYPVQTVTNDEPEGWSFNFWRSRKTELNCVNKLKFRMRKTEHVHEQIYITLWKHNDYFIVRYCCRVVISRRDMLYGQLRKSCKIRMVTNVCTFAEKSTS